MCGICGIVYSEPARVVDEHQLLAMRDVMLKRGPDDAGTYLAPGIGLGTRRLAILDLSEQGHMPMSTSDGRYWITYNGEVYNYRELRPTLESRGYRFRSATDTEVILNLYADEGPGMLDRLNGMFAFAIWDSSERTLFLARDRVGIKPLYYAVRNGVFYFASEAKALIAAGVPAEFDHSCWEELLCFRFIAGEKTPFVGVNRLLPGHSLLWKDGKVTINRWWNLGERAEAVRQSVSHISVNHFRETFDDAVALRQISDVPVGIFLSGGLDSSSIAATMAQQKGQGINSFNMRFDEPEFDEGPLAQKVALRWGLKNHEFKMRSEDLLPLLKESSWLNDEPLAHGNDLHLYHIALYAKQQVTVLLSGEGADETLAGYVRYRMLRFPRALNLSGPWLRPLITGLHLNGRLNKLAGFLELGSVEKLVLYNACNILPYQLSALGLEPEENFPYRLAIADEARRYSPEPLRQAMYLDQHTFLCSLLDRNDRMTMGASIECRVPFLDHRLLELAAAIPTSDLFGERQGKWILRRAMRTRLPPEVLHQPKWGFGVPWSRIFRKDEALRQLLNELPEKEPILSGPLNSQILRKLVQRFLAGSDESYLLLLQLVMLVVWYEVTISAKSSSKSMSVAAVC